MRFYNIIAAEQNKLFSIADDVPNVKDVMEKTVSDFMTEIGANTATVETLTVESVIEVKAKKVVEFKVMAK